MKVYERRASSPFKWILAGLVFVIAMTFTMAEVNGFNCPPSSNGYHKGDCVQPDYDSHHNGFDGDHNKKNPPDNNSPSAVPEPGTILLLASGLGLAFWNRSRKTA